MKVSISNIEIDVDHVLVENPLTVLELGQTSRFDRDSPGLRRRVPVSRKNTFGTQKCPGFENVSRSGQHLLSIF
jgi:hypothetical protein